MDSLLKLLSCKFQSLQSFLSLPSKLPLLQRFFINSTLFIFLSIIAAIVFDIVGGEIGSIEFWPVIVAVFCYQFIHTVFNDMV